MINNHRRTEDVHLCGLAGNWVYDLHLPLDKLLMRQWKVPSGTLPQFLYPLAPGQSVVDVVDVDVPKLLGWIHGDLGPPTSADTPHPTIQPSNPSPGPTAPTQDPDVALRS